MLGSVTEWWSGVGEPPPGSKEGCLGQGPPTRGSQGLCSHAQPPRYRASSLELCLHQVRTVTQEGAAGLRHRQRMTAGTEAGENRVTDCQH